MIAWLTVVFLVAISLQASHFQSSTHYLPHPDKVEKGGEDASLAQPQLLVVSDGVGGWNQMGIDPSKFSKTLIKNSEIIFNRNPHYYDSRPQELMTEAVRYNHEQGSATMVVLTLDGKNVVRSANLGDSGYKWMRRSSNGNFALMYQSKEQQHSFNFPYQLASLGNTQAQGDSPTQSQTHQFQVEHGDLLVVGSDGLFDNLYMEEVLFLMKREGVFDDSGILTNGDRVAQALAETATTYATDERYLSPFAKGARNAGFSDMTGGKVDDTTVIVAQVISEFGKGNTEL